MDGVGTYQPYYTLSPGIIKKIEAISRLQGVLDQSQKDLGTEREVFFQANIDAVHFSTKLEGNALTRDQVTQALIGRRLKNNRDLKEILNYAQSRQKLQNLARQHKPLTLDLVLKMHDLLLTGIVRGKLKGHWREAQNIISDARTQKIVYMPPVAHDVVPFMKSLVAWTHKAQLSQLSPLIVAPVFHYRFVTIHPFMDGNGRLARLFTGFLLLKDGYDIALYAALEKQHEINRSLYYKTLHQMQSHNFYDIAETLDLSPWLDYWLDCLVRTYEEALLRLRATPPKNTEVVLTNRLQSAIKVFDKYKRLSALDYQSLMGIERTQAVNDLNQLCVKKIIKKVGGGRSTVYERL